LHLRGSDAEGVALWLVCVNLRDLGNGGTIRRDGADRKSSEYGDLFGEGGGARLQVQAFELELGFGQLRLQQFAQRVNPCFAPLLLDFDHAPRIGFLALGSFQFAVHRVQFDIRG